MIPLQMWCPPHTVYVSNSKPVSQSHGHIIQWVLCFPSEKHIEERETWCQIKKLIVNKTSKLFQVVMRI